jgi:hypothetical protein
MIQRIQTVYLLLAISAIGLFLGLPLLQLEAANYSDKLSGWQLTHTVRIFDQPYIVFFNAIIAGKAAGFALIAIFLFKWRGLQQLFCWFSIVAAASALAFAYFKFQTKIFLGDVVFTAWNALPIVAVVFLLLAIFAIRKDENLLKSLNRLRD